MRTLLLVALALILYFSDIHFHIFSTLRDEAAFFIATLQHTANKPLNWFQEIKYNLVQKKDLVIENTKLHAQLLQQQTELQRLRYMEEEHAKLRQLLHYTKHVKQRLLTTQLLTAENRGFGYNIIDRGQQDGAYVGQLVVDVDGVFGRIVTVMSNKSSVMLLTDSKSAIPVIIVRNGLRAIAIGSGKDHLELASIPETFDIQVGDLLVTSGLEKIFSSGYIVGVVKTVNKAVEDRFMQIIITPTAHLTSAKHLFLVWSDKEK